eukprot:CAMPEP_0174365086 /NCGR_PEP_ID=MMETSP0811_2-20130205/75851_1 /TAXON_ID=73025 ORGANISM="Eutreptiella gymnastica-like, Strain CCMP1594" /NCGR_SAMPLE_ID=MMETSP0811_2 /ASSEMBLY_ACC=CAM_ASM_000667 /LENGTH=53 /DNA_ID=CAMNT_0015505415 /DNA_START=120 /DNA_END=282 /DNA_ORIENTATION=+
MESATSSAEGLLGMLQQWGGPKARAASSKCEPDGHALGPSSCNAGVYQGGKGT